MGFFEANSFKELINNCIPQLQERGIYSRMAEHLGVTNVYISQVFKADKHLSFEQGLLLAESSASLPSKLSTSCTSYPLKRPDTISW
jgi:hypothetical protein